MKERNVLYPPRPKLPRFRSHFPKTPANYGGKVDNHFLFRRQNECALRKVWPQSFDHRSCTKLHTIASRESNSNQGSPINKHSQHSHSFSPYSLQVHGSWCVFLQSSHWTLDYNTLKNYPYPGIFALFLKN